MSRLMEQEQQLLRQENERLQAEVCSIKGDLTQSREKVSRAPQKNGRLLKAASSFFSLLCELSFLCLQVRQLDATILSLKQHKHLSQSSLMKALEQENFSLKKELEAQRELTMVCIHAADYNQRMFRLYKVLKFSLHVLFIQGCEGGQRRTELESQQQENEALKAQLARLTTQLLEVLQLFSLKLSLDITV